MCTRCPFQLGYVVAVSVSETQSGQLWWPKTSILRQFVKIEQFSSPLFWHTADNYTQYERKQHHGCLFTFVVKRRLLMPMSPHFAQPFAFKGFQSGEKKMDVKYLQEMMYTNQKQIWWMVLKERRIKIRKERNIDFIF